jgi:signal transduction histidine kinase
MLKNKKILLCNDLKSDERFGLADFEKQGIQNILAVPLIEKENLIGIMSMFNKKTDHGFDETDRRFLSIVGSQVAKVLENARLFERENNFITELHQLRLQNMAKLAAGIAHEFNSPIGAIVSSADLVRRAISNLQDILKQNPDMLLNNEAEKNIKSLIGSAEIIEAGGANVKSLVNRLKSFVQLDKVELQRVDIHRCIEDCLVMLNFRLEGRMVVSKHFNATSELEGYPAQLNQVFYELILNSIEAIPEKGHIKITTYDKNQYIYVTIEDSGKGIPSRDLDHVFEPGFSTKGAKVGAGLGLPICFQIIKFHNGNLEVNSEPGVGTEVILKLPSADI